MPRDGSAARVGATVLVGLAAFAGLVFVVGEKDLLFSRKSRYFVQFDNVSSLAAGNPVQLNGVAVGKIEEIILPEDTGETQLKVWISVDRRFAKRIREDSLARIQTLGLLGDKFVSIRSGTPSYEQIHPGNEIPAAPATEIDELLASGGDVVANLSVAAHSLSNILTKMERGEGFLGSLFAESEDGTTLTDTVTGLLGEIRLVIHDVRTGGGSLGRLIYDSELTDGLDAVIVEAQSLLANIDEGEGLLPALLTDATTRDDFDSALQSLGDSGDRLSTLVAEMSDGDGLLPRLISDEELAEELTTELRQLLGHLNEATEKLNKGDGSAALLLNDPSVYEALNDILIGVDESKFLRWLVRDRQKSGVRTRYEESQAGP